MGYLEYVHSGEQERELEELELHYVKPRSRRMSWEEARNRYFKHVCPTHPNALVNRFRSDMGD